MKFQYIILISFILFAFGFYSLPGRNTDKVFMSFTFDSTNNYLVKYGEYIFKREGCINCHTLIQTDNKELISLDGLQQKFPNSWHFQHLLDPSAIVFNSKMPSFDYLNNKILNENTLASITSQDKDSIWPVLLQQADSILHDLKRNFLTARPKSEILALIAYLQSISASDELKRKNTLEIERLNIEDKKWDSLVKNANSSIYITAKNTKDFNSGKAIFQSTCFPCHGKQGEGGVGPNLTDNYWLHGSSYDSIAKTIIYGVPDRGMISWRFQLTPIQIGHLIAYIKSIKGTNPKNAKIKQGRKE